jgi:hypothetical protein
MVNATVRAPVSPYGLRVKVTTPVSLFGNISNLLIELEVVVFEAHIDARNLEGPVSINEARYKLRY